MESRWETLDACEAAVRREGEPRISTPHLSLVGVEEGELIRVGLPPRPEFIDWRYGPRLGESGRPSSFWARLLAKLPSPPVGGYDPYRGFEGAMRSGPWLASPFLEFASPLTYLFSHVPLAPVCPSCRGPLALKPWDFQSIQFLLSDETPCLQAFCAICATEVALKLSEARATLRMGLTLITPPDTLRRVASGTAKDLDSLGGPRLFLKALSNTRTPLGDLDLPRKAALIISLDELAELEALEAEWRRAEEMASIMDGELTQVPGFDEFRREILDESD